MLFRSRAEDFFTVHGHLGGDLVEQRAAVDRRVADEPFQVVDGDPQHVVLPRVAAQKPKAETGFFNVGVAQRFHAGSVAQMPGQAGGGLFDSVRTLSVHMYVLSSEGLHIDKTYATAVVLLVIVIGINALSSFVAKKITKKQG